MIEAYQRLFLENKYFGNKTIRCIRSIWTKQLPKIAKIIAFSVNDIKVAFKNSIKRMSKNSLPIFLENLFFIIYLFQLKYTKLLLSNSCWRIYDLLMIFSMIFFPPNSTLQWAKIHGNTERCSFLFQLKCLKSLFSLFVI
jgi:hypothetical protein